MSPSALGPGAEFDLIRRFLDRSPPETDDVRVGPGDDTAMITGGSIAASSDLSIEGVHFRRDWITPEEVGYRAAASSLSDLAAMAARPVGVLVSLAVPRADVPAYAERVMDGVHQALGSVGGALLGGDLTRSPGPVIIDVTALGEAVRPVLRSGAVPGDEVWVTGLLGGAAAAVDAWLAGKEPDAGARQAFARPVPRIREASWLAERVPLHALIDISDGLAGDASHLAAASDVGILLRASAVPVHPATRAVTGGGAGEGALRLALGGGEDYELCLAAPAGSVAEIRKEFEEVFGVTLSQVGTVREGSGVVLGHEDGRETVLEDTGFRHFQGDAS